jgi:hypothetical protein
VALGVLSPTAGDGVLIGGGDAKTWIVGRITDHGTLDHSFGHAGWTRLTPPAAGTNGGTGSAPTVESMLITIGGTVIVGGNNGYAHCCVRSYAAELSRAGRVRTGFGTHGWVLVTNAGSYDLKLVPLGDGRIAALGQIEFMGCGGPALSEFSETGALLPGVNQQFQGVWSDGKQHSTLHATGFERADGELGLLGVYSPTCQNYQGSAGNQDQVLSITAQGKLDTGYGTSFPMDVSIAETADIWAIPEGSAGVDQVIEDDTMRGTRVSGTLDIQGFAANGQAVSSGARSGTATIPLPNAKSGAYSYPTDAVSSGRGGSIEIVWAQGSNIYVTQVAG